MNDSIATKYYNAVLPAETLRVSPLNRLESLKNKRKINKTQNPK